MGKRHCFELTHNKGEHIIHPDHYLWECAACGKERKTLNKITPRGNDCIPVQIKTMVKGK